MAGDAGIRFWNTEHIFLFCTVQYCPRAYLPLLISALPSESLSIKHHDAAPLQEVTPRRQLESTTCEPFAAHPSAIREVHTSGQVELRNTLIEGQNRFERRLHLRPMGAGPAPPGGWQAGSTSPSSPQGLETRSRKRARTDSAWSPSADSTVTVLWGPWSMPRGTMTWIYWCHYMSTPPSGCR